MLTRLYVRVKSALSSDLGATALEYGILVALIALAIVLAVTAFGGALSDFFGNIAEEAGLL